MGGRHGLVCGRSLRSSRSGGQWVAYNLRYAHLEIIGTVEPSLRWAAWSSAGLLGGWLAGRALFRRLPPWVEDASTVNARRFNSCRTVPTAKPDCLASSRRCSHSSRTPNGRRNTSAFTFEESKSARAFTTCAFTIRSCGYTIQITGPVRPFWKSSLLSRRNGRWVGILWIPRGHPMEPPWRLQAACADMPTPCQSTPPQACQSKGRAKPPPSHLRAIYLGGASHPQATFMRPSCDPQATPKPEQGVGTWCREIGVTRLVRWESYLHRPLLFFELFGQPLLDLRLPGYPFPIGNLVNA